MCLRQVQQFRRRCSPEAYSWAVQGSYSLMFSSVYEIAFSVSSCWRCFPCDICYIVGKFFRQAEFAIYLKIIVTFCAVVASWTNSENIGFQQAHQHFWYIAWMKSASIPNNSPTVRCSFQKTRFQTTAQTIPMSYLFDNFASEKHLRVNDNLEPFPNIKKFFEIKKTNSKDNHSL